MVQNEYRFHFHRLQCCLLDSILDCIFPHTVSETWICSKRNLIYIFPASSQTVSATDQSLETGVLPKSFQISCAIHTQKKVVIQERIQAQRNRSKNTSLTVLNWNGFKNTFAAHTDIGLYREWFREVVWTGYRYKVTWFLTRECESNERVIAVRGNFTRSLDGL